MLNQNLVLFLTSTFLIHISQAGYLDRLKPVLELRFDKEAAPEVELSNGVILRKSAAFPKTLPQLVKGPHEWTGAAWDFRANRGGFLFRTTAKQAKTGDIAQSNGMTVSFWVKGFYTGRTSRIMSGL
ncbi:MAG: hypothetical protein D6820_18820, partial [Lentisphaerae bacterium]